MYDRHVSDDQTCKDRSFFVCLGALRVHMHWMIKISLHMRLGTHEISSLQRCLEVMERIENPWASQHNREHRVNLKIPLNWIPRGPWAFQVTRRYMFKTNSLSDIDKQREIIRKLRTSTYTKIKVKSRQFNTNLQRY